jgi:DNA-binding transcriptional ArsR family regulator
VADRSRTRSLRVGEPDLSKGTFGNLPKMALDGLAADRSADETEELTDPRAMRALAHPLRLALIELLRREGTLNATEAAGRLGESQASCSFHLRQLAKFGFVEEVEGVGGRARPWRLSRRGLRVSNVQDDPEAEIAWAALERLLRDRQLGRYREWLEGRSAHSRVWREAAYHSQGVAWLTPEELEAVADRVTAETLELFPERREDPAARPAGALPVELLSMGYPIAPHEN